MSRNDSQLRNCARLLCGALSVAAAAGVPTTPSGIGLISSSNPSTLGHALTLTAIVSPGATGHVTFSDGVTILGGAIIRAGQATFTTSQVPAGAHRLHAHYSGDATYFPSDSTPLPQAVTTVPGNGFQQVANAGPGGGFPPAGPGRHGLFLGPRLLIGDFNGDGIPDIVTNDASVRLGNADGTFQTPIAAADPDRPTSLLGVGDFNGDGNLDLVVDLAGGINDDGGQVLEQVAVILGNGHGTFGPVVLPPVLIFPQPVSTVPLFVADFNGDGKADLVVASSILLGNGDGTFQAPRILSSGSVLAVSDFNGDGKPDIAFATVSVVFNLVPISTDSGVAVMLGNGDGTFQAPINTPVGHLGTVVTADFNGDGKADLVSLSPFGILTMLLGNGDGTFQVRINYYPVEGAPSSIYPFVQDTFPAVGDFNGDGKADLVVSRSVAVSVLQGNGDGTFQPPVTYNIADTYAQAVVGEFNGDGRTDFVVLAFANLTTFLAVASPDLTVAETHLGSFIPGTSATYSITVTNLPFAPTTGAVTVSDSLPPGITPANIGGSGWSCVLGTLTCSRSDSLTPGSSYPPIVIAVNAGNNVPGIITNTATVSGGGDVNPANNKVSDTVLLRTGATALTSSPNPAVLGQPVTFTAATTPGSTGHVTFYDGVTVLGVNAVVSGQASLTTRLLLEGSHSLHARFVPDLTSLYAASNSASITQTITEFPANGFLPVVTYADGVPVSLYVALGDFNGDGKTDFAVAGGFSLSVSLGNGDGTFRVPIVTSIPFSGLNCSLTVADINGDGKADLVLKALDNVHVLLGDGDGTFQSPHAVAGSVGSLVVADFNNDGKADLAFLDSFPSFGLVTMLLGNGDGTFAAPIKYVSNLPDLFVSMVAGDFNGDGKVDLAIAAQINPYTATSQLDILLGNGDGTFGPPVTSPAGNGYLFRIGALADFNGDGKSDLAINYFNDSQVTVLLGNGDGTFQQTAASYPGGLAGAGDLNGDGKADLVIYLGANNLRVLIGNGNGTFQAPIIVPSGGGPGPVAIADFNGDGRADVAVANGQSMNVGILLGSISLPARINLAVWRPANGTWYVNPAGGPPFTRQWGLQGDIPMAVDFDSDGTLDYAVWRPSNGTWYVTPSGSPAVPVTRQWGLPGDIPVAADFDGDGKADYAVWRPSNGTWYILPSSNAFGSIVKPWGLPNDIPVIAADFDGDGKPDYAVWRPSEGNWYITLSSTGATVVKQWGLPGDIPVAADFDDDGYTDYAVWRPSNGTWYIIPSSHPTSTIVIPWGLPGDIPVPRDYDGDGKPDLAVWRPSNGTWYIIPSSTPAMPLTVQWGLPSDVPIYKPAGN